MEVKNRSLWNSGMIINSQAGNGWSAEDDAIFGLFYTHPNNAPEYNASVTFPILNQTAVEELTGGGSGGSGGDDAGLVARLHRNGRHRRIGCSSSTPWQRRRRVNQARKLARASAMAPALSLHWASDHLTFA